MASKKAKKAKITAEMKAAAIAAGFTPDEKAKAADTPKVWVLGRIRDGQIEVVMVGDHNTIEAHSKEINKEAGYRAAFVVDARAFGGSLPQPVATEEEEEEEAA